VCHEIKENWKIDQLKLKSQRDHINYIFCKKIICFEKNFKMDSEFDMNLNLEIGSTGSDDSSVNSDRWCRSCEESLWQILRRHNACPFCNGRTFGVDNDDSDSSIDSNVFSFWEEPSNRTDQQFQPSDDADYEDLILSSFVITEQSQPSDDADFEDFASPTSSFVIDEPQAEELEIHHYPIRSTRSDVSSYYETPLRNRFWTRRSSSSRSRRE